MIALRPPRSAGVTRISGEVWRFGLSRQKTWTAKLAGVDRGAESWVPGLPIFATLFRGAFDFVTWRKVGQAPGSAALRREPVPFSQGLSEC